MELNDELVGFRFEYDSNLSIERLQNQNNKTYIVYLAQFFQSSQNNQVSFLLDIIDCVNPSLQGFRCIDFSKVSNYSFSLNSEESLLSQVNIFTYGCLDLDSLKTTIPNKCTNQTEIDSVFNGINAVLRLKLYTSQFSTTTKEVQVNYRNAYVYTVANQFIFSRIKAQKQISQVKTGYFIQSQTSFSSPIEYNQQDQSIDRQYSAKSIGQQCYSQVMIYPDELIQQVKIQFPTLPQVFAQVNSVFTLLMLLGIVGRSVSNQSIKKDFLMLFLKNLYQSNYFSMTTPYKIYQTIQKNVKFQKLLSNDVKDEICSVEQQKKCSEEQVVQVSKLEDNDINQIEEICVKSDDEINQSKSIPLFVYIPSFQSVKSQQENNSNILLKSHSICKQKQVRTQFAQQNLKPKKCADHRQKNINKNSFIQKYSLEDKQTLTVFSDSIFSSRNQRSLSKSQKSNFKEGYLSNSQMQNTKKSKDDLIKQANEKDYQMPQENKINIQDENIHECIKKLKATHDKQISSKIWNFIFGFRFPNLFTLKAKFIFIFFIFNRFCKKRKQSTGFGFDVLNEKQQKKIENHINQDLDILNFINDVIFLKKAVILLLRKDQLAALKLVGFQNQIQKPLMQNKKVEVSFLQIKIINIYSQIRKGIKLLRNVICHFVVRGIAIALIREIFIKMQKQLQNNLN